jgi:hypothetical protein
MIANFSIGSSIIANQNLLSPSIDIDFNKNTTEYNATWYQRQWLKNSDFSSMEGWNYSIVGDTSDVEFVYENNAPGMKVVGDSGNFSLVSAPPLAANWTASLNPEFPAFPEWHSNPKAGDWSNPQISYGIDMYGFWTNHSWREGPKQTPSIQWVRNFSLPVNMSDYKITSAAVQGVFNATVDPHVDAPGDSYNTLGSGTTIQGVTYDYVRFYIKIADLQRKLMFEIAYNKTFNLGKDGVPEFQTINDTFMSVVSEELLITFLSAVLNVDQKNFMVIVGIDIMCEDSFATDADLFDMLRIKSISLNFTYEKQINQGTYLELKQEGDRLSGANTYIQSARMWYKYKADDDWVASSPNSEYRVLINGIPHTEIKRFSQANTSFQDINEDGMDVTKIVLKEQNILVAIQFYLADLFYLDKNITLYVTDLQLEIVWVEVVFNPPPPPPQVPEPGPDYTPVIRGLLATIAGMITLAIVYQLHWKYPPKIRKLRAIRRKLNSGKPIKTIAQSKSRDALVEEIQVKELKKNKIVKKPRAIESEQIKPELDKKASVDLLQNGLPDVSNKAIGLNIGDKAEELKKETDLSPLPDKPKMDEHVEG